jgi:hypothetical protein
MGSADVLQRGVEWLDAVADLDLDALADGELDSLVVGLQRLGHRLVAQQCRTGRCWEQRGVWSGDGSRSPSARLSRDGGSAQSSVRTVLWRGRCLASTPLLAAAFAAGDLSADRVDRLLAAQSGRAVWFARDEELLVAQARGCASSSWARHSTTGATVSMPNRTRTVRNQRSSSRR